jgi:hypothetical protein
MAMLRQSDDAYEIFPIQAGMLFHALSRPGSGIDIEQIVAHLEEARRCRQADRGLAICNAAAPGPTNVISMVGLPAAAAGSAAHGSTHCKA